MNEDKLLQVSEILDTLSDKEREEVLSILADFSDTGELTRFNALVDKDFEEVPVDIETFITDPQYLGKSFVNEDTGKCVIYPFWINKLRELFNVGKVRYTEAIFTGAIGLGKTTIAVIGAAYTLYKLMCLRNPNQYYEQKADAKIYIGFFNITLDLAEGVAYSDFQEALQRSPWFLARGEVTGRKNLIYNPPKNIAFLIGSKPEHALGKNVFCLVGDTDIRVSEGYKKLADIDNKIMLFNTLKECPELTAACYEKYHTKDVDELIQVTLSDGTVIQCTDDHRFLLSNGEYKRASEITEGDDLQEVDKPNS